MENPFKKEQLSFITSKEATPEDFHSFENEVGPMVLKEAELFVLQNDLQKLELLGAEEYASIKEKLLAYVEEHQNNPNHFSYVIKYGLKNFEKYQSEPHSEEQKKEYKNKFVEIIQKGLSETKNAVSKTAKFAFTRVLPVYMAYLGSVYYIQKDAGKFSEKDRARKEMEDKGITSEQASTYKMGMSEMMYRGITPIGYPEKTQNGEYVENHYISSFVPNIILGRNRPVTLQFSDGTETKVDPKAIQSSEDAWSLYLGLPQKFSTFGISEYKPEKSDDDKYYFKINIWSDLLKEQISKDDDLDNLGRYLTDMMQRYKGDTSEILSHARKNMETEEFRKFETLATQGKQVVENKNLLTFIELIKSSGGKKVVSYLFDIDEIIAKKYPNTDVNNLLNNYTVSLGQDEKGCYISYYDKWDLNTSTENSGKGFGHAFEIYDRVYYNPETGEIIGSLLSK